MPLPATTKCSSGEHLLSLTHSAVVRPTWFSAHSQALVALKEVDRVQVVPAATPGASLSGRRRQRAYTIEVFRAPASKNRIPTNRQKAAEPSQRPAVSVTRGFDGFAELHDELYHHVHNAHESALCPFCEQVMTELVMGSTTPNPLTRLLIGDAKVALRLTKFLNSVLELNKGCSTARGEKTCAGREMVPLLLHDFIMVQDAEATALA